MGLVQFYVNSGLHWPFFYEAVRRYSVWKCLSSEINAKCATTQCFMLIYTWKPHAIISIHLHLKAADIVLGSLPIPR